MAALNVEKCTSCGRLTPSKHGECIYCQTSLKRRPSAGAGRREVGHEEPRDLRSKRRRFQRQSDDRSHYLVVETREPIELEPGKLFVIGRDSRASLVVHATDVSRQHCEIDWDDHDPPRPLVCEVRSTNGTFLNGELVTRDAPRPLRSGDEVRLGEGFTITYLHVRPRDLDHELSERGRLETLTFRQGVPVSGGGPPGFPPAQEVEAPPRGVVEAMGETLGDGLPLEGNLSSGEELLQQLHGGRESGVLSVFDGSHSGDLVLVEGRCTRASFGGLTGRSALELVASLRQGMYRFLPDGAGPEPVGPGLTQQYGPPLSQGYARPAPPVTLNQGAPLRAPLTRGYGPMPGAYDMSLEGTQSVAPIRAPRGRGGRAGPPPGARPLQLEGDLRDISGTELWRTLQRERRTGTLTVYAPGGVGEVVVVDGNLSDAALGGRSGGDAVEYLLDLDTGRYRFRPELPEPLPHEQRDSGPLRHTLRSSRTRRSPPPIATPPRGPAPPPPGPAPAPRRIAPLRGGARAPLRAGSGSGSGSGERVGPLRESSRSGEPRPPLRPPTMAQRRGGRRGGPPAITESARRVPRRPPALTRRRPPPLPRRPRDDYDYE